MPLTENSNQLFFLGTQNLRNGSWTKNIMDKQADNNHTWGLYFYDHIPVIRTTDDSKQTL